MPRVIFAGGPGAGKTSVLKELASLGFATTGDAARTIIAERRARGLGARPDALSFAREIMDREVAEYHRNPDSGEWIFFDRGVVDAVAMLEAAGGLAPQAVRAALDAYSYHRQVFVFPPWEAIYRTDAERDHSFEHARRVHAQVMRWYRRCGYEVLDVPRLGPAERARHVLNALVR